VKLHTREVEKPWGRTSLPPPFGNADGRRIGEIWFEAPGERPPLLAKYIFTSEKLSVQVHPGDAEARARGLPFGKDECWYILDAGPGATVGLGPKQPLDPDRLREAAESGAIEALLDWRPIRAGDVIYVPAGTIHAIGGDIALLELQRNVDVTYRLYDYGRARELHLEEAVEVARAEPFPADGIRHPAEEEALLVDAPTFTLLRTRRPDPFGHRRRWVLPLSGSAAAGGESAGAGECLLLPPGAPLQFGEGTLALIGAAK
jgi:mannose-6-phosphate isomerase